MNKNTQKPTWWPENPYPASVFPMPREKYAEIVPDDDVRTGLSGMLGREFWDIAADAIWEAMQEERALVQAALEAAPKVPRGAIRDQGKFFLDAYMPWFIDVMLPALLRLRERKQDATKSGPSST